MKKLVVLLAVALAVIGCTKDEIPPGGGGTNPIPGPVTYAYSAHKHLTEPTDTVKFRVSGNAKLLDRTRTSLPSERYFGYNNLQYNQLINETLYLNNRDFTSVRKTITYDNGIGNSARITSIETLYKSSSQGSNYYLTDKENQIFTYSNNYNTITIQKQKLNINTNAVLSEEVFVVNIGFKPDPIVINLNYLYIDSVKKNSTGITTTYSYDNSYNVYKKLFSIDQLVLSNWDSMKITHNNIIREVQQNDAGQTVSDKAFTCTYDNQQRCLERKDNGAVVDKYTYKTE